MRDVFNINSAVLLFLIVLFFLLSYFSYDTYIIYNNKKMVTMLEEKQLIELNRSNEEQKILLTYMNVSSARSVLEDFKSYVDLSTELEIGGWSVGSISYGVESSKPPDISITYNGNGGEGFYPEYIFGLFAELGGVNSKEGITFSENGSKAEFYVSLSHDVNELYHVDDIVLQEVGFDFEEFVATLNNWSEFYKVSSGSRTIKILGKPEKIYDLSNRKFYKINLTYSGDFFELYELISIFPGSVQLFFETLIYKNGQYISNISGVYESVGFKS